MRCPKGTQFGDAQKTEISVSADGDFDEMTNTRSWQVYATRH